MAIITLARQVGSGGQTIATALAARLGYAVHGRRELRLLAEARGLTLPSQFADFADEDRLAARSARDATPLYVGYGELEFDEALRGETVDGASSEAVSFLEAMARDRRAILYTLQSLIYDLASRDQVILVGAGGQLLLAGLPGVLRVKITAPSDVRAQRMTSAYGLGAAAAETAVWQGDREQRAYNRAIFNADWDDPLHWDLVINTEIVDAAATCNIVAAALRRQPFADGPAADTARALAVAGKLSERFLTDPVLSSSSIMAAPTSSGIAIEGHVATVDQREHVTNVLRTLDKEIPLVDHLIIGANRPPGMSTGDDLPIHSVLPSGDIRA